MTEPGDAAMGGDFYYASLYRSPAERDRQRLAHAIYRVVAAIPLEVSDRGVARVKIDWWHAEAAEFTHGRPRHELTRMYGDRFGFDDGLGTALHGLAVGLDRELGGQRFATRDEQSAWFGTTFGPVYEHFATLRGGAPHDEHERLREFGSRIEMAYALLEPRPLALKGLSRFPADLLEAAGAARDDFVSGANPGAVTRYVEDESERLGSDIARHAAGLSPAARRRSRTLVTLATIVGRTLAEMRADGCRVWLHRIHLTPVRKLWCALRTRWR